MVTIEHFSGVGINGRYRVKRDGKVVAVIHRNANRGWYLDSIHYNETLSRHGNIDQARLAATERISYPTADEVYEIICQRIEGLRRKWKTETMAEALAKAAAALAGGSNSAYNRLIEISREIEAFAKDRTDTGNHQYLDHWCGYSGSAPTYPAKYV